MAALWMGGGGCFSGEEREERQVDGLPSVSWISWDESDELKKQGW